MRFLSCASLTLLFIAVSSCGGTEAGNPNIGTVNPTSEPANSADLASVQIVNAVCAKLTTCNPTLSLENCSAGVEAQKNLGPTLGAPSVLGSFSAVIQAESTGVLKPDPTRTLICVSQIESEGCTSPGVSTAFSPIAPTIYTSVINMIPTSGTSCAGVF